MLLGDFNFKEFDWVNNIPLNSSDLYVKFTEIMPENFLSQIVDQPTRENNILDLSLTINEDIIDHINVGEPFSDHNKVTFKLICKPYVLRHSQKQVYVCKKADWDHLKSLLQQVNFDCALNFSTR